MHPTNQLLQRNLELFNDSLWYLAFPPGAGPLPDLPGLLATSLDFSTVSQYPDTQFGLHTVEQQPHQVVLYFPKAKAEAEMLIHWAASQLAENGQLFLVGENKGGIKSAKGLANKMGLEVSKIDSARHCTLLEVIGWPALLQEPFILDQYYQQTTLDSGLVLYSLPGVFSHGRLDIGTALLLNHLPTIKQNALDFGCGCGAIGATLLQKQPNCTVDFCDVSWLALTSAEKTCQKNGFNAHQFIASDGLNNVNGRYELIVSNPPFHQGVKTRYDTTERFLEQAYDHLKPGGQLLIVANRFLDYEPIIEQRFGHCTTLAQEQGFKILSAHRR